MTESKFWSLMEKVFHMPTEEIEKRGYEEIQNEIIKSYLKGKGKGKGKGKTEIIEFHKILCEKVVELYLPKIGELFLLTSYELNKRGSKNHKYISTDGFIDFRAWIVSLGKEEYETFLDFQSEFEVIHFNMNANREDLIYLSAEVSEKEFELNYPLDKDVEELYSKMNWDNLDEKHPNLFKLYQDKFKK